MSGDYDVWYESDHDGCDEHDEGEGVGGEVLVEDITNDGLGGEADVDGLGLLQHHDDEGDEGEESGLHWMDM